MTALKLLYVDDEPDIREIAVMALKLDPEMDVRAAGSGREALDILRQWPADVVLLDLMMPQMEGRAILAKLRALPRGDRIAVIFVTARTAAADHAMLHAAGVQGVITKPFDPMTFAATVRRCLPSHGNG